mgnify:CR=1 FL=1
MSSIILLIWLASIADKVIYAMTSMYVLTGTGIAYLYIMIMILDDFGTKVSYLQKHIKPLMYVFVVSLTISLFTPPKEAIYTMAAVKVTSDVAQTPTAQKAIEAINSALDNYIQNKKQPTK